MNQKITPLAIAWLSVLNAFADVTPSNLFADNMVIQRDTEATVWGQAEPGEAIIVSGSWGKTASTTAGADGKWMVRLATPEAGGPHTLTFKGTNTVILNNVLAGDIWLCSGQSNMMYTLEKDSQAAAEIPRSANSNIRVLNSVWQASDTPLESVNYAGLPRGETDGTWTAAAPESSGRFSAVGYWFAKNLQQDLKVPIGLISASKGGSPVEAWMPKEALLASDGGSAIYTHYEEALKVFPEKHAIYLNEMEDWREKVKGLSIEERNRIKQPRPPYGPIDGNRPCGLFYGSIHPCIPFAIKGVLWYQGESNACSPMHKAVNYESAFTHLIRSWRTAWGREDLPFLFVQLPGFRPVSPETEDSVWSRVRDAQTRTLALPHTGMAVTLDVGNEKDIHPKNKQPVGDRLAQWAKASVYGQDLLPSGPLYDAMKVDGATIVITFKHHGKGLEVRDLTLLGGHQLSKDKLQGFSICGADQKFVWADAEITGLNQVTVSNPDIAAPLAVRYAWSSFPLCNLYNKDGLPASSFRTDSFEPESLTKRR